MSQHPSGWYDDPSNPDLLRYWDGVSWTNHTAPKKSPTASQSTIGLAQQGQQGQGAGGQSGATTPVPQDSGWQTRTQTPQQQGYAQAPAQAQWMHDIKTTADGVPLASWGRRVAAWLIDGVILGIVAGTIAWVATPALRQTMAQLIDAASRGDQAAATRLQGEMLGPSVQFGLVLWLVVTAYCLVFWTTTGQTVGKMAVGISVRRAAEPGPLPVGTALLRRLVPLAGEFISLLTLIDYLWPLWDDKRQALHDKLAGTQVVMGKQPRKHG